jgi:hypothetical protein
MRILFRMDHPKLTANARHCVLGESDRFLEKQAE